MSSEQETIARWMVGIGALVVLFGIALVVTCDPEPELPRDPFAMEELQ